MKQLELCLYVVVRRSARGTYQLTVDGIPLTATALLQDSMRMLQDSVIAPRIVRLDRESQRAETPVPSEPEKAEGNRP